jgi:L-ascorbate metabolism protein UlaG (beta-lactamase superfamily)
MAGWSVCGRARGGGGGGYAGGVMEVTLVGGPTALIQYAGLRWLTDPTFSEPGTYDGLTKTTGPQRDASELEPIDVVLLSHDHHADNLDPAGRAFLPRAGAVLTTTAGADRLGRNATGMEVWSERKFGDVTVTAVPALHGPPGSESVTGPVIGFVLSCPGQDTLYVSGDNASLEMVGQVAARLAPVDVALLFVGAVQIPMRFDGAYLTLSSDRAAMATERLGARAVVPVHFEGWSHFTQGLPEIRAAFAGHGLSSRLVAAEPGQTVSV